MNLVEYICVFVRASGARLLAAERLVCSLPQLLGPALSECDLVYTTSSRYLVVTLRFTPERFNESLRARLNFWTARAGGRVLAVGAMSQAEQQAFRLHLESCELKEQGIQPGAALRGGREALHRRRGAGVAPPLGDRPAHAGGRRGRAGLGRRGLRPTEPRALPAVAACRRRWATT